MEIQLLGHSMLRIVSEEGKIIVVDPWISGNPTCPKEWQDKNKWADVDLVLCTHSHFDHASGLEEVLGANDRVTGIVQYEYFLHQFVGSPLRVFPLNFGGTYPLMKDIKVTMVPANHSNSIGLENAVITGPPAGFIIKLEDGFTIYVSGDTGFFSEMKTLIKDFYHPDLAVLSIDGVFTMGPEEGAYAASIAGARYNIPCHWFPKIKDAADPPALEELVKAFPQISFMMDRHLDFAKELEKYSGVESVLLSPGEAFSP
jgi:L-ascorbate metabolism protein UlaG (beta-lactamase superfamily)